jgi:hypothetical protein
MAEKRKKVLRIDDRLSKVWMKPFKHFQSSFDFDTEKRKENSPSLTFEVTQVHFQTLIYLSNVVSMERKQL